MSETPDQAATRRRWVTLAEVVAVAGVVIAALTLWINWSDRKADEAERHAARQSEVRERARIDLTGTADRDGRTIALKDDRHDLTDVVVAFPKALGVGVQRPVEPQIDSAWFADALLKLTDGGADERTGRLPVLVSVRYWDGDRSRAATGLYDLVWKTEGHVLRGRTLRLQAFRLRQRGGSQASVDAAWARAMPAVK